MELNEILSLHNKLRDKFNEYHLEGVKIRESSDSSEDKNMKWIEHINQFHERTREYYKHFKKYQKIIFLGDKTKKAGKVSAEAYKAVEQTPEWKAYQDACEIENELLKNLENHEKEQHEK